MTATGWRLNRIVAHHGIYFENLQKKCLYDVYCISQSKYALLKIDSLMGLQMQQRIEDSKLSHDPQPTITLEARWCVYAADEDDSKTHASIVSGAALRCVRIRSFKYA
ncbi:hypothetical protein QTP88_007588 [Uroleucon formosanum]